MSRKFVRRGFKLGAIVGAGFFLAQVFLRKQAPSRSDKAGSGAPAQPTLANASPDTAVSRDNGASAETEAPKATTPAKPSAASVVGSTQESAPVAPSKVEAPAEVEAETSSEAWVDPPADGSIPASHPIKAKLSSKIFHAPGGVAYDRTTPDRLYRDAATAESDGFRAAKR